MLFPAQSYDKAEEDLHCTIESQNYREQESNTKCVHEKDITVQIGQCHIPYVVLNPYSVREALCSVYCLSRYCRRGCYHQLIRQCHSIVKNLSRSSQQAF